MTGMTNNVRLPSRLYGVASSAIAAVTAIAAVITRLSSAKTLEKALKQIVSRIMIPIVVHRT